MAKEDGGRRIFRKKKARQTRSERELDHSHFYKNRVVNEWAQKTAAGKKEGKSLGRRPENGGKKKSHTKKPSREETLGINFLPTSAISSIKAT